MCPFNGIFTGQFIFRSIFLRILNTKWGLQIRHNQKPETKKSISGVLIALSSSFCSYRMRTHTGRCLHFRGKKCSKVVQKITSSVKTPLHRPSIGVACSDLMAFRDGGFVLLFYVENWHYTQLSCQNREPMWTSPRTVEFRPKGLSKNKFTL